VKWCGFAKAAGPQRCGGRLKAPPITAVTDAARRKGRGLVLAPLCTILLLAYLSPGAQAEDPTGYIPSIRATVTGLRFFEGAFDPAPPAKRNYDDLFFYNAARYIHWEMNLVHPAPGHRTSFTVEEEWVRPQGAVFGNTRVFTLESDWTFSYWSSSARLVGSKTVEIPSPFAGDRYFRCRDRVGNWGPCPPAMKGVIEDWQIGSYQVDLLVEKRRVATGRFGMMAKDDIYAELRTRSLDRSSPSHYIASLKAKVDSLRFFESGAEAPPPEQRRYSSHFSETTTRNIVWEIDLKHGAPGHWVPVTFEALLYLAESSRDRLIQRKVLQSAVPGDWSDTYHMDHFGWYNPYYWGRAGSAALRSWQAGAFRVDLYLEGKKVASGSFQIH